MTRIFPFMDLPKATVYQSNKNLPVFKEYAWDFENNEMVMKDGSPVVIEREEALKVWIYKALVTPRYRHMGYSWRFGSELERLIGSSFSTTAAQNEADRYCREALLVSPYIKSVTGVSVAIVGDVLTVDVTAETIYGGVKLSV